MITRYSCCQIRGLRKAGRVNKWKAGDDEWLLEYLSIFDLEESVYVHTYHFQM